MPPTPAAFRELLLDLDTERLTAFVAAVYAARGWDVTRDGDDLRVRAGGERDWLRLVVDPDRPPTDADRVVVPTLGSDADADDRVIDAADLLELVWYALDAADRTRLCRDFFGRDPTAFETPTDDEATVRSDGDSSDGPGVAPSTDTAETAGAVGDAGVTVANPDDAGADDAAADSPPLARRLAVGVVILLVVGGVAVAVGPTLLTPGDDAPAGSSASGVNGTASSDTQLNDSASDPVTIGPDRRPITSGDGGAVPTDGSLPPGVDATGIENASALVDAHEAALDGRSYRLTVVAREFVGGRPTAVARERTVVEGPTRYRSDVSVIGTFRQEPRAIGTVSTYANGTTRFVRLTSATDADGTIRFTERGGESETAGGPGWRSVAIDRADDPFANRTATHLRGALDVDDAVIVGAVERDGTTYVWIDLRRRPPGGTDAIDSILVDEHGLVHEIRHEYAYLPPEASTVRTVVTVRIEPANVTVSPPPWL